MDDGIEIEIVDTNLNMLKEVKDHLFDILTEKEEEVEKTPDAILNQTVGVALTKAARQQGAVNVFQLQSVVMKKITDTTIKSIKVLDKLIEYTTLKTIHKQFQMSLPVPENKKCIEDVKLGEDTVPAEVSKDPNELVKAFLEVMAIRRVPLKDLLGFVTDNYIETVMTMHSYNATQADKFLKVSAGYISRRRNKNIREGRKYDNPKRSKKD